MRGFINQTNRQSEQVSIQVVLKKTSKASYPDSWMRIGIQKTPICLHPTPIAKIHSTGIRIIMVKLKTISSRFVNA